MNNKLPFLKIIAATVFFAWSNKAELLKAISVPTLVLVVIWGAWLYSSDGLAPFFSWIFLLGYGLGFSLFAVTCHRLILIDVADRYKPLNAKPGFRELRFLGWVIVIYAIAWILENFVIFVFQYLTGGVFVEDGGGMSNWIKPVLSIPAYYIFARMSLAFPAAAIDRNSGPRWSWARTRGNGWRIFMVVGLFPWLISMVIWLLWREEATVTEQVVLSIFTYVGLAIEIIALSFTYKEMAKQYAPEGQFTAGEINPLLTEASLDSFHEQAQDGRSQKVFVAVNVVVGLAICYVLIGSLMSHFVDCNSELISSATSPDGAYKAELLNRSCKDNKNQGLILEIVKTSSPKTVRGCTISKEVSKAVDVVWTSDKTLLVRHTKSLDLEVAPILFDEVQIAFE